MSALALAAEGGFQRVVRSLLAKEGIDINSKNEDKKTPLALAAELGHEAAVKLLLAKDNVDLNPKDRDGNTPLAAAAVRGQEATVKLLLEKAGVDINPRDSQGKTSNFIKNHGIPLLIKGYQGNTPLEVVRHKGIKKMLASRLEREAVIARLL